jgi:hypothetical protein
VAGADSASTIEDIRRYLQVAGGALARTPTRASYFQTMADAFPEWLNPGIAWFSVLRRLPQ